MPSAYLLVTHGSRDLRYQAAIADLAERVQQRLSVNVGMAVLECSALSLHQQIEHFCHNNADVQIVPLFLLPGVHVMEDIPEQIAIAQQQIRSKLTLMPHLGISPKLSGLLAKRFASIQSDARILLSHGSRRSQGNLPVETLAAALDARPAYWSVSPDLAARVQEFSQKGCQRIAILPYFLFIGGITDAIARQVAQLSEQFSQIKLELLTPVEVNDDLVDLIVDFISAQNRPDLVMSVL